MGLYPLNDYQQLMLKISRLTPYNAVHLLELNLNQGDKSWGYQDLSASIDKVIQDLTIGKPLFTVDKTKVSFKPIENPFRLQIQSCALPEHLNAEMNYQFHEDEFPLRFCFIEMGHQYFLSITYNHWIADAYGISRLVEAIFSNKGAALSLNTPKMQDCFPLTHGVRSIFYRMVAFFSTALKFSTAYRPRIGDIEKMENESIFYTFEPEVIARLRQYCKHEKITINDLFVAILGQIFGEQTSRQRATIRAKKFKPKRNQIIIAILSNIRHQSRISLDSVFSVFLGFFYIALKKPENIPLRLLCKEIHSNIQQLKNSQAALKQSLLFKIQNLFWDRKKHPHAKYRLFNKNTPMTVAISNMEMRHLSSDMGAFIKRYIRFSPTAMVCPIVFNLTTFDAYLSLGINFQKACYCKEDVDEILFRFVTVIHELVEVNHLSFGKNCLKQSNEIEFI